MSIRVRTQDKILLHLYEYRNIGDKYEYPPEITQAGIAGVVGISVSHIPRNINKMINLGLVMAKKGHVPNKKKRVTVYFLTERGVEEAKRIIDELSKEIIEIDGKEYKIGEIKKRINVNYVELLSMMENEKIDVDMLKSRERVIFKEIDVTIDIFVNRIDELQTMKRWYKNGKMLSIVGSRGYGKSALIAKFIERVEPREHIVWLEVYKGRTWKSIQEIFKHLFGGGNVIEFLRKEPVILIFDDYFDVDDVFVEKLRNIVNVDIGKSKVIVTMRPDTPYYNRFYTLADVAESRVTEIKIGPLSYENSKLLLPDVKDFAFRRIYQLTRGNPLLLYLLRTGKIEEANDIPVSAETVHLLKYLASQKKE